MLILAVTAACAPAAAPSPTAAAKPTTAAAPPSPASSPAVVGQASPVASPSAVAKPAGSSAKPAEKAPAPPALDLDALYAAAKQEGKVVYYSGDEPGNLEIIRQTFGRKYPGIDVQGQEGRGQDAREKIIAEQAARRVVADVVVSGGNTMAELIGLDYLERFQAPETQSLLDGVADRRGYVNPRVVNVYGLTINVNSIPPAEEPKSWKDLAEPRFRGKVAAQDPRGSGGSLYILTGLTEIYGEGLAENLAKQSIFFGTNNAALVSAVVRGEQSVLLSASAGQIIPARREGAPIKFIKPEEGVILIPIGMAVVKNGPHPNAARLFINWMLSEEGQKIIADQGDTPARKGVTAKEPEGDLTNAKVLTMRYDGSDRDETAALSKKFDNLFFK